MTKSVSILLPAETVERAKTAARAHGQSLTAYLQVLIGKDLAELQADGKLPAEEAPEIVVIDAVAGQPFVPDRDRGESLEDYEERKALFNELLNGPQGEDTAL
ncbi:MAG: hypothetical protein KI792_02955 [Alphaproteobacteria bacterium]|nr:hypothetical protein [Alphaproteobacteria bacterium SS10]